ncbi:MAG: response regulator transcription factor [Thermoguttaceae bacterium]
MRRYRILIVDDHPVVRYAYGQLVSREPDMEVCGEADDAVTALQQAESQKPDVALIDISLPGETGIGVIESIKGRWPAVKMLAVSTHDEQTFAGRVLRAGAMGYISKREPLPKIIEAIRRVLQGEVYLSPQMSTNLLYQAAVGRPLDGDPVQALSNRELQVFQLIGEGISTVQIAERLEVSPKTIESHRKVIKTKLNLRTSAQLSRRAFQWAQERH